MLDTACLFQHSLGLRQPSQSSPPTCLLKSDAKLPLPSVLSHLDSFFSPFIFQNWVHPIATLSALSLPLRGLERMKRQFSSTQMNVDLEKKRNHSHSHGGILKVGLYCTLRFVLGFDKLLLRLQLYLKWEGRKAFSGHTSWSFQHLKQALICLAERASIVPKLIGVGMN